MLHSVDLAAQAHVHDDQLRLQLLGHAHRLAALAGDAGNAITQAAQRLLEVLSDDAFILDDQNGGGGCVGCHARDHRVVGRRRIGGRCAFEESVARLHVEQCAIPPCYRSANPLLVGLAHGRPAGIRRAVSARLTPELSYGFTNPADNSQLFHRGTAGAVCPGGGLTYKARPMPRGWCVAAGRRRAAGGRAEPPPVDSAPHSD